LYLSGLLADAQQQSRRQQVASWRASESRWITERTALHAELDRSRDELLTAQAWIDRLQDTLTLSHARMSDTQSELHVCERLIETLLATHKR